MLDPLTRVLLTSELKKRWEAFNLTEAWEDHTPYITNTQDHKVFTAT